MCFGIGESLFIARPVIYAGLMYYFHRHSDIHNGGAGGSTKRRAFWTPWLVSLFVDVASLSLLNMGNKYARGCVAAGHPCPDRCATRRHARPAPSSDGGPSRGREPRPYARAALTLRHMRLRPYSPPRAGSRWRRMG